MKANNRNWKMAKKIVKTAKKIVKISILSIACIFLFAAIGWPQKATIFRESEHMERISKRVQKAFMNDKHGYTDFTLYPLYDENEKLKYFLVEFEPFGFKFILIKDEQIRIVSWLGGSASMYREAPLSFRDGSSWSPYKIDETNSQPYPDRDIIWILDQNGEIPTYKKSPYHVAEVQNTRRYLLYGDIVAIKQNDKFINLISYEEIEVIDDRPIKKQAALNISFIPKVIFDI